MDVDKKILPTKLDTQRRNTRHLVFVWLMFIAVPAVYSASGEAGVELQAVTVSVDATVPEQQAIPASPLNQTGAGVMTPSHVIGQVVVGLLVVTALIFVLAWLAKRMGYANFQGGGAINVIASIPLGGREKAVLVEVDGQRLLLGVAPGRVNHLQTLPENTAVETPEANSAAASVPIKKGQEFARYLKAIVDSGKSGSKSSE